MVKIALLFPGQGSQYIGMGKEFFEKYEEVKRIFNQVNEIMGYDLKKIIFEGPENSLKQTEITQPAIFVTNFACFKVFAINYQLSTMDCLCAGHSLGEYSALVACRVLSFEEGLQLVKKRAEFIQETSKKKPGKMAAILGLNKEKIEGICSLAKSRGIVEAANFNCPGQIVISGENGAVDYALDLAKEEKAKVVLLKVSGPFHSSLMKEAGEKMAKELKNYQFHDTLLPVVTNCDAEITISGNEIKEKLVKQIYHPVLWEETIRKMFNQGVNTFIEIGPGKVLSGLVKRINESAKVLNIENEESLNICLNQSSSGSIGELKCAKKN
ncbi:MAG TPA: [acyl-carrier-protein] S-malonyltransferase [Elusimicrobia bacterium]|jgi:[acyl-carrier-protein] S-malonyltransferase|nr:[acyl-carrier-protein] S-malonyltransferase [Elusimicrobiota bacterium]